MISSEYSDRYRSKAINVARRKELIQKALTVVTENKLLFSCVTHLASHLSIIVSRAEIEAVVIATGSSGIENEDVRPPISKYTLLKSVTYRNLLDEWMEINCKIRQPQTRLKASVLERRLRFEILDLRNENTLLRKELARKERVSNANDEISSEVSGIDRRDLLDAYFMVEALLQEFEEFLIVQDGDLVVNNPLRRVLISSSKLQKYSRWHNEFNESRYFGSRGLEHKN